jgi:hypothetical protein
MLTTAKNFPKSLTLKMATATFAEMLENPQNLKWSSPESQSHSIISGHKNLRTHN